MKRQKRPCDFCRRRKRKCDGNNPCSTCLRSKHGASQCTFVMDALPRKKKGEPSTKKDFHTFNIVHSQIDGVSAATLVNSPLLGSEPDLELEKHLIELSFLTFAGYDCDVDNSVVIPSVRYFILTRTKQLSANFKRALCFHSVFFSAHPSLFPTIPTFQDRLLKSHDYGYDPKRFYVAGATNLEICDDIKAILVYANTHFSLGNGIYGLELISKAYHMIKHFHILESLDQNRNYKPTTSMDDLVTRDAITYIDPYQLTEDEIMERMNVVSMLLSLDTYVSVGSARNFIFDDKEIPALMFPPLPRVIEKPSSNRTYLPDLAKNTIWEKTPFAPLFDDARELAKLYSFFQPDCRSQTQFSIQLMKFIRKIVTFSREPKKAKEEVQIEYHNYLLQAMHQAPEVVMPFNDLTSFMAGAPEYRMPSMVTKNSKDIIVNMLVMISGFANLHFATSQIDEMTSPASHNSSPAVLQQYQPLLQPSLLSYSQPNVPGMITQMMQSNNMNMMASSNAMMNSNVLIPNMAVPQAMHHIPQMPIPNGNISADVQQMLSFQTNQMYSMYDMPTFAPFQKPQVTTTLFPGEAGGVAIYSSRDILFACLKSLEYLIHLSQPITPAESCVGFVPYKESAIQQCFQAPSTIPSPVFCQPICVLMSYIVASSTLIAFERVNSEQSMQVYRIIKECIYPTMMQITQVWPIADYYGRKLQTLLADYEGYHHNI